MIKRVRVANYKCLGNVDVELDPVTVLIGRSGTGKTSFVESLRFLRDYLLFRGDTALQLYGGWQKVLSVTTAKPVTMLFEITFTVPGIDRDFRFEIAFRQPQQALSQPQFFAPSLTEEKLTLGKDVLYWNHESKWEVSPRVVQTTSPQTLTLGAVAGITEITRAHLVLTAGIGWYAFPDEVLTGPSQPNMRSQLFAQSHGQRPQATGLQDNAEHFLHAYAAILADFKAWSEQKEMLAALRRINPSVTGLELRAPNEDALIVGHDIKGKIFAMGIEQESEGFRRFLASLLALYQRPSKETLLFEEPEKGIHPGAMELLAEELKACASSARGQVVLTTHSPDLLNYFDIGSLRVVDIEDHQTRIGAVSTEQLEAIRENLLRPGELFTVDPARVADDGGKEKA